MQKLIEFFTTRPAESLVGPPFGLAVYGFAVGELGLPAVVGAIAALICAFGPLLVSQVVDAIRGPQRSSGSIEMTLEGGPLEPAKLGQIEGLHDPEFRKQLISDVADAVEARIGARLAGSVGASSAPPHL